MGKKKHHSDDSSDSSDEEEEKKRKKRKKEKKEKKEKYKKKKEKRKYHSSSSSSSSDSSSDSSSSSSSSSECDSDSDHIPPADLQQASNIVQKLLEWHPEDVGKLKDMFESIDANELINIRDIGDLQIKNAFVELFKLMRIMPQGVAYKRTGFTPKLCKTFRAQLDSVGAHVRQVEKQRAKEARRAAKMQRREQRKLEKLKKKEEAKKAAERAARKVGPARPSDNELACMAASPTEVLDDDEIVKRNIIEASERALAASSASAEAKSGDVANDVDDYDTVGPFVPKPGQELLMMPEPINMKRVRGQGAAAEEASKKGGREEWMTELPPDSALSAKNAMTNRGFSSTGKESRGDTSVWTDTPADRQRKAETARALAEQRALHAAITGHKLPNPDSGRGTSNNKPASVLVDMPAPASSSSSGKTLAQIHDDQMRRQKRAETDPRFAQFDPRLLEEEFDREKLFGSVNLDSKNSSNLLNGSAPALNSRFASTGTKSSFL